MRSIEHQPERRERPRPEPPLPDRRLAAARVLALQRTHGNQAVLRLLERRPAARRLQRKVGFELEESNWHPYIKEPGQDVRPARRKEPLHAQSPFVTLEADDTGGPHNPSLEFVTVPFATDGSGLSDLTTAFGTIRTIMDAISPHSGKGGPAISTRAVQGEDGSWKPVTTVDYAGAGAGAFVQSDQHGLDPRIWLSGGRAAPAFKLQATQGISLEDLPTIMRFFGSPAAGGETQAEKDRRDPARKMMHEGRLEPAFNNDLEAMDVVANAPVQAALAVAQLKQDDAEAFTGPTAALTGFLAQAILYVKRLTVPQKLAKYDIPLLARTDFVTMFQLLPDRQQQALRRKGSRALIRAVVNGANAQMGRAAALNLTADSPVAPAPQWGLASLTIGAWIRCFSTNDGPVDFLNSVNVAGWLEVMEPGVDAQERTRRADSLESLAVLGDDAVSKRTDKPDVAGHTRMPIFENRAIEGNFDVDGAYNLTWYYLKFFTALRTAKGAEVKYPESWMQENVWTPYAKLAVALGWG